MISGRSQRRYLEGTAQAEPCTRGDIEACDLLAEQRPVALERHFHPNLLALGRKRGSSDVAGFVLGVLAIQVALNAVFSIRTLFLVRGASDAETMARLFVLPSWFWAGVWMAISVAMLVSTLKATRGR